MLLGHSIKLILLRMIRHNHKCIDTRHPADGCTDKVIMNWASQCFRDLLVQGDLPVVVWEDDIANLDFIFPVNLARALDFQRLLGDSML